MAIATIYQGIEYRSRLEARWAAFFHRIGWKYTYEPFDGDGYIPDFLIHGAMPLLVEVKPAASREQYESATGKVMRGLRRTWTERILIVGADPITSWTSTEWPTTIPTAGLLAERLHTGDSHDAGSWSAGLWISHCYGGDGPRGGRGRPNPDSLCDQVGVWHDLMGYDASPCGHHSGGRPPGTTDPTRVARRIQQAWADATNDVKWRGRPA